MDECTPIEFLLHRWIQPTLLLLPVLNWRIVSRISNHHPLFKRSTRRKNGVGVIVVISRYWIHSRWHSENTLPILLWEGWHIVQWSGGSWCWWVDGWWRYWGCEAVISHRYPRIQLQQWWISSTTWWRKWGSSHYISSQLLSPHVLWNTLLQCIASDVPFLLFSPFFSLFSPFTALRDEMEESQKGYDAKLKARLLMQWVTSTRDNS